jgi:hypothetical protein
MFEHLFIFIRPLLWVSAALCSSWSEKRDSVLSFPLVVDGRIKGLSKSSGDEPASFMPEHRARLPDQRPRLQVISLSGISILFVKIPTRTGCGDRAGHYRNLFNCGHDLYSSPSLGWSGPPSIAEVKHDTREQLHFIRSEQQTDIIYNFV